MESKIWIKEKCNGDQWTAFLNEMSSGRVFECDDEMYYYWLEVLPPASWGQVITLPDGTRRRTHFGFAEGEETITVFWNDLLDKNLATHGTDERRYFGMRTNVINRGS